MKILLTGSKGQLGQSFLNYVRGHEYYAYDQDELDITNARQVLKYVESIKPDIVINAAAYNEVDKAEKNELLAYRVNAMGPRHLAVATNQLSIPLVHVSSDYVFDGEKGSPYHEYDQPNPLSVYAKSKLAGEQEVQRHNPKSYIVRTAWLFHQAGHNFLKSVYRYKDQPEVRVVNDQIGSPTYAPHLAIALGRLITTQHFGVLHMAAQGQASWFDLAKRFYELIEIETPIVAIKTKELERLAKRPAFSVLTTIEEPAIELPSWKEGLSEFVEAFKKDVLMDSPKENS